jgi:hypothetical protein
MNNVYFLLCSLVNTSLVMALVHWTYNLMEHPIEVQKSHFKLVLARNMRICCFSIYITTNVSKELLSEPSCGKNEYSFRICLPRF